MPRKAVYHPSWDLSTIPDAELRAEWQRRTDIYALEMVFGKRPMAGTVLQSPPDICAFALSTIPDADLRAEWQRRPRAAHRPRSTAERCPCGAMTAKRAQARGRSSEHAPGCAWHKDAT